MYDIIATQEPTRKQIHTLSAGMKAYMKMLLTIFLIIFLWLNSFANGKSFDIEVDSAVRVLVLIPYDEIANAGVSPDTQKILESSLAGKGKISVIPFPFKKLMGVPYQMVYDKKYCKPIIDKVDCDVIIMTKIITENERKVGDWPWAYKIRVYNIRAEKQLDSIHGENLESDEFARDIKSKIDELIKDIALSFNTR